MDGATNGRLIEPGNRISPLRNHKASASSFVALPGYGDVSDRDGYPLRLRELAEAFISVDGRRIRDAFAALEWRRHGVPELGKQAVAWPKVPHGERDSKQGAHEAKRRTWEAQGFRCRYCGTRTVHPDVLGEMVWAALRWEVPFYRLDHWETFHDEPTTHPSFWWQSWTWDHIKPHCTGGSYTNLNNLYSVCYPCQDRKSQYDLQSLRWQVLPSDPDWRRLGPEHAWWGLRDLLPSLTRLRQRWKEEGGPEPIRVRRETHERHVADALRRSRQEDLEARQGQLDIG